MIVPVLFTSHANTDGWATNPRIIATERKIDRAQLSGWLPVSQQYSPSSEVPQRWPAASSTMQTTMR